MYSCGSVVVLQAPERLDKRGATAFLTQFKTVLDEGRPRLVLDCSEIRYMDSAGVEMLLRCMEEAIKRDGDLKLAAVAPTSAVILELMKVDRLFETFDTPEDAVQSFYSLPAYAIAPWMGTPADEFKAAS